MHGQGQRHWWEDEDEELNVTDETCDTTNGVVQQSTEQTA